MTEEVLVVVDAQPEFTALDGRTIRAIHKEIQKAVKNKQKVFHIKYEGFGEICEQLLKPTESLDIIVKNQMGGGNETVQYWQTKYKKLPCKINVVGVDTVGCVVSTACELASILPQSEVRILRHGCNTTVSGLKWGKFFQPFLDYYKNLRSVG